LYTLKKIVKKIPAGWKTKNFYTLKYISQEYGVIFKVCQ
jgi:hypothetical protein